MSKDLDPPRRDYDAYRRYAHVPPSYPERYVIPVRSASLKRKHVGDWLLVAGVIGMALAGLAIFGAVLGVGDVPLEQPVPPVLDLIAVVGLWLLLGSGVLTGVGAWLVRSGKSRAVGGEYSR